MKNTYVNTHICLAGDGRLATQLKVILEGSSLAFSHISRKKNSETEMSKEIERASHIWLAISDSGIDDFHKKHLLQSSPTAIWVHFSGALNNDDIHSAHPLMTFSQWPMTILDFEKVHFVVTPKLNSSLTLNQMLPGFKNSWSSIDRNQKAFYHALCVIAGNFPMILWSEVSKELSSLNVPKSALHQYLDHTLNNFKNQGEAALTGPLARNDLKTILANLQSLDDKPLKTIYEAFVKLKGIQV